MRINKTVIKVVCFCLIFSVLFLNIQSIFQAKWGNEYYRTKNFFLESNEDVIFVGSSHVHCTINPLILFENFGFTSRNFTSSGQELAISYLYIKEAIQEKKPKLIVLDMFGVIYFNQSESNNRKGLDPLPLSKDKIDIQNYISERNAEYDIQTQYGTIYSYAFPLLRYHSRWKEIVKADFVQKDNNSYLHGYVPRYDVQPADFSEYYKEKNLNNQAMKQQKEIFDEIVSLCEMNDVALLLIKSPTPMWNIGYHNLIKNWAEEKSLVFIDYNNLMDDLGILSGEDFSDATSHLNDIGATKVTLHLGNYIDELYELPDRRDMDEYVFWFGDLKKHLDIKKIT